MLHSHLYKLEVFSRAKTQLFTVLLFWLLFSLHKSSQVVRPQTSKPVNNNNSQPDSTMMNQGVLVSEADERDFELEDGAVHHRDELVSLYNPPQSGILTSNQVTWAGQADPKKPTNWSLWRRWSLSFILSLGGLVSTMSTVMMAPAMDHVAEALGATKEETNLAMSIYILAFAIGGLVLAPLSEVIGRVPV